MKLADHPLLPAKPLRKRGSGRPFVAGVSGNPAGRPKLPPEVRERARHYGCEMVDILRDLAVDPKQTGAARVAAAIAVLDRGFGKPTATLLATVDSLEALILAADATAAERAAMAETYSSPPLQES